MVREYFPHFIVGEIKVQKKKKIQMTLGAFVNWTKKVVFLTHVL